MKDIQLWRLLTNKSVDAVLLVPMLEQLASLSLRERFPFFGPLEYLFTVDDARLRSAALRVIAGGTGHEAVKPIVDRLMDDDESVRRAAVDALYETTQTDLPRLAHALFHPKPDVRSGALDKIENTSVGWYALYLCEDATLSDRARALAKTHVVGVANAPLVVDLYRRSVLTFDDAITMIYEMRVDEWLIPHATHQARSKELIDSLQKLPRQGLNITGHDTLDDVLDLVLRDHQRCEARKTAANVAENKPANVAADKEVSPANYWLRKLIGAFLARDLADEEVNHIRSRVWFSIQLSANRLGWSQPILEWATVFTPYVLHDTAIPKELRRQAIGILYDVGRKTSTDDKAIRSLLRSDLARKDNGHLDLWAIGGLLFRSEHPYKVLEDSFTQNQVTAAFLADPEGACAIFCLPDEKGERRMKLVKHILSQRKQQSTFIAALLVFTVNADGYDFLENLEPREAIAVLEQIAKLLAKPEWKLSRNKRSVASRCLSRQLAAHIPQFLEAWLERIKDDNVDAHLRDEMSLEVLANLANESKAEPFIEHVLRLSEDMIAKLLDMIPYCHGFPYGYELLLANKLKDHDHAKLASWASERLPDTPPISTKAAEPVVSGSPLTSTQSDAIRSAPSATELARHLKPALEKPRSGVTTALAERIPPPNPHLEASCALLGCRDSLREVDVQFARYAGVNPTSEFLSQLDEAMVEKWITTRELWMIGHAWLWRWERHLFDFAGLAADKVETLCGILTLSLELQSSVLRSQIWLATVRLLKIWRAREKPRFIEITAKALLDLSVRSLQTDIGLEAANIVMLFHDEDSLYGMLAPHRDYVTQLSLDLPEDVRKVLDRWISSEGLTATKVVARSTRTLLDKDEKAEIASSTNLERLADWCRSTNGGVVNEATLRLLELGYAGQECLVDVLMECPIVSGYSIIAESIPLWEDGQSIARLRTYYAQEALEPQRIFMLGLGLIERGERSHIDRTLAATSDAQSWFRTEDWHRLLAAEIPIETVVHSLVVSPQPHAYKLAVNEMLQRPASDVAAANELLRFLECGLERLSALRQSAATWLMFAGDESGAPILMKAFSSQDKSVHQSIGTLSIEFWQHMVDSALRVGNETFSEWHLMKLLQSKDASDEAIEYGHLQLMMQATQDSVQQMAVHRLRRNPERRKQLRKTAEIFHWGIQKGRELTGRLFRVEMIGGEALGYTRLNENRIYINPITVFQGVQHAEDIVRGLVVHELGHHMYHRGEKEEQVWKQAEKEGIGRLLNLVTDEHLERNLRALDDEYGNQLKRLGAYAFQHARKEYAVETLLSVLRANAFTVLTNSKLSVANDRGCVRVEAGRVLLEAERQGHSFSRFFRALRMGLGNRHNDPLVAKALKLFDKQFRHASMNRLLRITRQLRDIFQSEVCLLDAMEQDRLCRSSDSELRRASVGTTNAEVQSEIQRIERKEDLPEDGGTGADRGGGRFINVIPDIEFETIDTVVPVNYQREAHYELAQAVKPAASRLRRFLQDLGSRYEPTPRRLQGSRLSRPLLRRLVIQRDPRVLVARERQVVNDLFISVVVDCSGSMDYGENMERAKRFGALVAEAAKGIDGIDVRLFGFTDSVIYDAGTAMRPAVASLESGGGNNDAAALWHAAKVALASKRKAKLVVMISDGLPTECSVDALTALVQRLTYRMNICCAQAAVQPLTEECFEHYVLLDDGDINTSVREFGRMIAKLIRQTVG